MPTPVYDPERGRAYPAFGLYFRRYAPFSEFGFGFEGDNRGTSTSLKATSRTYGCVMFNKVEVFTDRGDRLPSTEIVKVLNEDEEAPWRKDDKHLTAEGLASTLRDFHVETRKKQEDGERHWSYYYEDLAPVFDKYLDPIPDSDP